VCDMSNKDNETTKISSVLELAKWQVGSEAYWIINQPTVSVTKKLNKNLWARSINVHPKTIYERRFVTGWPKDVGLPKIHALEFNNIVDLVTSQLSVGVFKVDSIYRCPDTGEFIYSTCNDGDFVESMPESCLFKTREEAQTELTRLFLMVKKWVDSNL